MILLRNGLSSYLSLILILSIGISGWSQKAPKGLLEEAIKEKLISNKHLSEYPTNQQHLRGNEEYKFTNNQQNTRARLSE